ncbi:hypothetical protein C1N55_06845 [Lysinibacillus sp. SGAir0095]|nr:hypothetical protein C1N55_06845 [Lysinibacillus sp. SGAir0095]
MDMAQRIYCLNALRESPLYSEPERSALELTDVVTRSIGLLQARNPHMGFYDLGGFSLKGAILEKELCLLQLKGQYM